MEKGGRKKERRDRIVLTSESSESARERKRERKREREREEKKEKRTMNNRPEQHRESVSWSWINVLKVKGDRHAFT